MQYMFVVCVVLIHGSKSVVRTTKFRITEPEWSVVGMAHALATNNGLSMGRPVPLFSTVALLYLGQNMIGYVNVHYFDFFLQ